jgi:coatomer protein complex subunit gamma
MSKSSMVQFHALCLLLQMRANDKMGIMKTVTSLTKGSTVRSPLAACVLIRKCAKILQDEDNLSESPQMDFLEVCLRHKNEMVVYEAASAICSLRRATPSDLVHAITVLQMFLSSSKPTLRFAAVRTLNRVAISQPLSVTTCNVDLESLISDSNRSIATLATTTLLKTGSEHSVDRLMKQISNFMSEIADEFKIVVVDAIRSMCIKYPNKHRTMMNFLSSILREEGGFEFKKAIVDSILILITNIPDVQEAGLAHLCEFIEDCEYTQLSTAILHLIGERGPHCNDPSKYIRFIYNRIVLENATVRASAVCAMAKFGMEVESLRTTVSTLLQRCIYDNDDEVRDRATFFLQAISDQEGEALNRARSITVGGLPFPVANLEESLKTYLKGPTELPFDSTGVSKIEKPKNAGKERKIFTGEAEDMDMEVEQSKPAGAPLYAQQLAKVPEFASCGKLFCSTKAQALTESETEYMVKCVKHIFDEHVIFQFTVDNTIEDQMLENVTVSMECEEDDCELEEELVVPVEQVSFGIPGVTYVCFRRDETTIPVGTYSCRLKYTSKDVDPETGEPDEEGYDDEYEVDSVEIAATDYMRPVNPPNFRAAWDALGDENFAEEQYALGDYSTIKAGVDATIEFLGMSPCEGTQVVPDRVKSHTVLMAGVYVGGCKVLSRANVALAGGGDEGVTLTLQIRSDDEAISELISSSVG